MKFHTFNDWKKKTLLMRSFELIPSLCLCFHQNYKLESARFSWLGFTIGIEI